MSDKNEQLRIQNKSGNVRLQRNIEARSATIVVVEKQYVCVFTSLLSSMQCGCAVLSSVACPALQ